MEAMYIEELKSSVNQLMANLESMPVSKGGEFKIQKLKRGHNTSIIDMGQEDENTLSKSDVVLSFTLEVWSLMRAGTSFHRGQLGRKKFHFDILWLNFCRGFFLFPFWFALSQRSD